jgi:hypothetical protein
LAGVAGFGGVELLAQGCRCLGAPGGGELVEPDEQLAVAGVDVAGDREGLADQGAGFVFGAGVAACQGAGQGGLGVVGGHPDGVGDLLGLGVQPHHVRGQLAEPDPSRDRRGGGLGGTVLGAGGLHRGVELVDLLVGDDHGLAGGGLRSSSSLASRAASAAATSSAAVLTRAAAAFFAGLGTSLPGSSRAAA